MNKELQEKLKTVLEGEKKDIEKELAVFAKKDKTVKDNWNAKRPQIESNADMEEMADETEEYENLITLEQNLEVKLKDINDALEKMKKGSYGICENCGQEIEEERLKAYPAARLCMKCNH